MNYPQLRYASNRQCPVFDCRDEGLPVLVRRIQGVRYGARYADGVLYYLQGTTLVAETLEGHSRWRVQVGEDASLSIVTALILGSQYIYLVLTDGLHVLRKADGKAIRLLSPGDAYLDDACFENGELIVLQENDGLISLNCYSEDTLSRQWSTALPSYLHAMAADDEMIIGAWESRCIGFDRRSGHLRWEFDVEELGKVEHRFSHGKVGRYPMLFGTQVVVPVNGRYVVGLDRQSGRQNWATETKNLVMSGNTTMDQAGNVHVFSTHYSRLNGETGFIEVENSIVSEIIKSNIGIASDPLVVGDFLFCGSSRRQRLFRFNLKSMAFDWIFDLQSRIKGAPICVDGHLIVHDDKGGLTVLRLDQTSV